MTPNVWMVRAGEGGQLLSEFEKGYIAIGYHGIGDLSDMRSRDSIMNKYVQVHSNANIGKARNQVGVLYKFRNELKVGDIVLTYDVDKREYIIGEITGDYIFNPGLLKHFEHIRTVQWKNKLKRDDLSIQSRNSLGSTLAIFSISDDIWDEITGILTGHNKSLKSDLFDERIIEKEELEQIKEVTAGQAHELIKDKVLSLDDREMEQLVAAILRAMGYKTKVSPPGADRGVDVLASRDGLGFEEPRIKAEVKHRPNTSMGTKEVRSFIAGLRQGDRGLYVSTGGFSKEAKYEADRASLPVALVDLDDLAKLIVSHYENFDLDGKALIRLIRIYWPAE